MTLKRSLRRFLVLAALLPAAALAQPLTDEEVWPKGVNGPKKWPPELENSFSTKANNYRFPEGGDPPPLDLHQRIKCPTGSAKVRISKYGSARWETSRWHPPIYAFDEWSVSRWSSWDRNAKHIWADLGSERAVTRVVLVWETAYGKDYDIQVSSTDTNSFATAKAVRGGNGQADVVDLEPVTKGRFVQMLGVAGGSSYGYSLYEFTICAAEAGAPVKPRQASRWGLSVTPEGWPAGIRGFDALGKTSAGDARKLRFLRGPSVD